jgi:2-C-methyl-D-erythritol 2,4-cyclodiphosphate synthase
MHYRVGIGYDIHRLVEGRKLFIGGIEVPYIKGSLGHSDADVLLHAVCDALLGAASFGDIGEHFPDTEARYHDIPSGELLKEISFLLKKSGFVIGNIDTVVIAEEPKLMPFKRQIQASIAEVLEIRIDQVSVKAKTNEGLGEIGKKEAISAYATVMIARED